MAGKRVRQRPCLNENGSNMFLDFSHTIESGMITYKGLPAPVICDYLTREKSREFYAPGTEFQIGRIDMVSNTGTYVDSPFHRYPNGKDLSQLPLENLANLEAIVIRTTTRRIDADLFRNLPLSNRAVLIHTGWSQHWRTDRYFENHPYLTEDAAGLLAEAQVKLVGIDSHNIDDTSTRSRPVHSRLLGAEIPIAEHLCGLEHAPPEGFRFFAVPPKVAGFGTFPVRAFGIVHNR